MIYINKELEKFGDIKLFRFSPLRSNIIPKDITLETGALIEIFCSKGKRELLFHKKKYQEQIWKKYFKLEKKEFKRNNKLFK